MAEPIRIVITGGPGTGKSSLIRELSSRGHLCHEEYSRTLIREQLESGGNALPWEDLLAFSHMVIAGRVNQYLNAHPKTRTYFDRGIPDSLAYLVKDRVDFPQEWWELAMAHPYSDPVYITPPWEEIYLRDDERREDFSDLLDIHHHLVTTYTQLGYQLIELPKVSVEERIGIITQDHPLP